MQILRLLAARRAASTITAAPSKRRDTSEGDEGPFFDLVDFSSCSVRTSSSGSSGSDSDESCAEVDFIIYLQRTRSASPPLKLCASEPSARANSLQSQQHGARKRGVGTLRSLSFGARKAAPLYGRPSFEQSSSGRRSFARPLRLFLESPPRATEDDEHHAAEQTCRRAPSRHVIRRCLANISRQLRTAATPRAVEARGLRRLRKCRSASSAAPRPSSVTRPDDSAAEKQDGIAGAIAHCKETLHRASTSEPDSTLLRSRSE